MLFFNHFIKIIIRHFEGDPTFFGQGIGSAVSLKAPNSLKKLYLFYFLFLLLYIYIYINNFNIILLKMIL